MQVVHAVDVLGFQQVGAPAFRSACSEACRDPVNRQITMTLASASMTLPAAQPASAAEPAASPAASPTAPSMLIHPSDAQASHRAALASRRR